MLFSEPKIPQNNVIAITLVVYRGFSALQRAENSSERSLFKPQLRRWSVSVLFSEPKIPQKHHRQRRAGYGRSFSALQRAENSSEGDTRRA